LTTAGIVLENLGYLDRLLNHAFQRAQEIFEREAEGEVRPWELRGLHISRDEADRLLAQNPGAPALSVTERDPRALDIFDRNPVWRDYGKRLGLRAFDQATTMIALAPEVDLRYERMYAYLQDDITRRRPTVGLAMDILSPTAEAKLNSRTRLAADSALIRLGLLKLVPDASRTNPSWLDYTLSLDQQAVAYLLGQTALDGHLASFSKVVEPAPSGRIERQDVEAVAALVIEARKESAPLTICFHGPRGSHQREAARWIAFTAGAPLLMVNLQTALAGTHADDAVELASRYAGLRGAIAYYKGVDALLADGQSARLDSFQRILAEQPGVSVLSASQPWLRSLAAGSERAVLNVPFEAPHFAERRSAWYSQLRRAGLLDDQNLVDKLAGSFDLSYAEIAQAVAESAVQLRWQAAERPDAPLEPQQVRDELFSSARAQAGHELAALARKIDAVYTWKDIVLPAEIEAQLHEIAARAGLRYLVLDEWGFGKKLANSQGVTALFTGPSGAGKTMAAEVLANELTLDLYKIDLSGVVSKYIGETEKNLERIFAAAERSNAILFFDEADALFGKRSEVHDAHDRYANIEVSYLLQRMEQYEGIAILATNLRANLDEAFVRRLTYTVRFPLPAEAERLKIWDNIWPSKDLLDASVDLPRLARVFKLSGGNIRNVALAASFFAAARGGKITQDDILKAIQREYDKVGKTVALSELQESMAA
jgi:AAA+ superfamily predicted ATPase